MKYHYNKPEYSQEALNRWANAKQKRKAFKEKHSYETVKIYKVNDYFIKCIQRKYDECMKKENEFGIQVFISNPANLNAENIMDECILNDWFKSCDEANKRFKDVKAMCY